MVFHRTRRSGVWHVVLQAKCRFVESHYVFRRQRTRTSSSDTMQVVHEAMRKGELLVIYLLATKSVLKFVWQYFRQGWKAERTYGERYCCQRKPLLHQSHPLGWGLCICCGRKYNRLEVGSFCQSSKSANDSLVLTQSPSKNRKYLKSRQEDCWFSKDMEKGKPR